MLARFLAPTSPQILPVPGLPAGPLAHGLVAAWDFTAGSLTDLIRGLTLTRATNGVFAVANGGQGLYATATGKSASVVCPAYLKLAHPFTIVVRVGLGSNLENEGCVFGVTYDTALNDDDNPSYSLQTISALRNVWVSWRTAAAGNGDVSLGEITSHSSLRTVGIGARFTAVDRAGFYDGVLAGRVSAGYTDPAYTADAELRFGDSNDTLLEYALIYNRALSNAELAELTGPNPWGWKGYRSHPAFWQPDTSEVAPEIAQSFGPLVWVEWEGSDDTIRVWAPVDLPDPSTYYHGYKAPKLLSAGRVVRALSDEQGEYQGQTFEVTVSDVDGDLRTLLGLTDGRRHLLNTRMVMRMISQDDWRARRVPRTVAIGQVRNYRLH